MTLEHISSITASSSRISASVDGKGKRLARYSWSRRSIKWSADDSSKNSRCNGRCAGPIFCCRRGRESSTRIWTTYSAVGIQNSGRNHKRRSQSARRLDPRLFGALYRHRYNTPYSQPSRIGLRLFKHPLRSTDRSCQDSGRSTKVQNQSCGSGCTNGRSLTKIKSRSITSLKKRIRTLAKRLAASKNFSAPW
jgi:hypothetical protein